MVARLVALLLLGTSVFSGRAMASEAIQLPPLGTQDINLLYVVLASAFVAIGYGVWLFFRMSALSAGTTAMQDVAAAIQQGALAYLRQQVGTMIYFVLALSVALYLLYRPIYSDMGKPYLATGVALAFLLGVGASYAAGYVGMMMAVRGNVRTAQQALSTFKGALETAFQSGAVSGMFTVGLGLLGATVIFLIFRQDAMRVLIGFGFGGSLAALFMRVGGGIFTKAADVGADLVGKVEHNIPEDDPRNAAVIADNVGDNVGDCAGMAADVFESYEVTLVAAIILGAGALSLVGSDHVLKLIMYPLLVRAVGVVASIVGVISVKASDRDGESPMLSINRGFWISALVAVIGFGLVSYYYLGNDTGPFQWWQYFAATFMGIVLALVIGKLTEYYTSPDCKPVTEIAYSARTGPATMILSGFSIGLESSVWGVVAIAATLAGSVAIFHGDPMMSAYGIALAGLGLLTTTGYILAMDTFGPISDNANGIFEMSGCLESAGPEAYRIVAKLDMAGNTTKALTKGFAIATAVIAAVALFRSFMQDAGLLQIGIRLDVPEVFIGALIGGAVPFLFCAMAINAVSRAATRLIEEVRRQFREIPGIMSGTAKPDYGRCVAIVTAAAQKELLGPGILAIATPILVAFALGYSKPINGAAALGGYLAGAIIVGQLMAVMLSNSGGAWDNAKKKIEDGLFGGKGTEEHKAGVICDTVGDPFKDTAGPALNPIIKVMNLVAILIAPVVIQDIAPAVRWLIVVVAALALAGAVLFAKRGSLADEMTIGQLASPAEAEKVAVR